MDNTREQIRLSCCRVCIVKKGTVSVSEKQMNVTVADIITQVTGVLVSFGCNCYKLITKLSYFNYIL